MAERPGVDFVTYLREAAAAWTVGTEGGPAHVRLRALVDERFRLLMRQALQRYDAHRYNQVPLWGRIEAARGSVTAPVWAATCRRIPPVWFDGLRADAAAEDLSRLWQEARTRWPSTLTTAVAAAPRDLNRLLSAVPELLAAHVFVSVSGLLVPEDDADRSLYEGARQALGELPHSVRLDERRLGNVLRRAVHVAVHLGGLGIDAPLVQPLVPSEGASAPALQLAARRGMDGLLSARRDRDPQAEQVALAALESSFYRLGLTDQAHAAGAQAVAAALARNDRDLAAQWLIRLAQVGNAQGDAASAVRLHRLVAATSVDIEIKGNALREAASLAVSIEQYDEALAILRDEAALQDASGNLRLAGVAWLGIAKLFYTLESDAEAESAAEAARRRLAEEGTFGLARQAMAIRAESLVRLDRLAEAVFCLEDAIALASDESEHEIVEGLKSRLEQLRST